MQHEAARQVLRLLWRRQVAAMPRSGPRPRLNVDDIVRKAIETADEHGLPALTMRTLAEELGVKVMTLYSYVPDKAALLNLMVDEVHGELRLSVEPGMSIGAILRNLLDSNYRLLLAHGWLIEAYSEQPPMGPGTLGKYERELAALVPLGLPDTTTDAVLTFLLNFARASAGDYLRHARAESGNEAWWDAVQPVLSELITAADYPLASRIGTAAGAELGGAYNAEAAYDFGVDLVVSAVCRRAGVADEDVRD